MAKRQGRQLWEYIEPFAGYGFNKSHSVAYAMLAYKTAYLKAHYPHAFMAAMMTSEMGNSDTLSKYSRDCRDMGIELLAPDVNRSCWGFSVEDESIRFGLGAVKGVGEGAIEAMLVVRNGVGEFSSMHHFCCEVDPKQVNRKVLECLVKAGSFDFIDDNRRRLFDSLESVLGRAQRRRREIEAGQGSLFGEAGIEPPATGEADGWGRREVLQFERETLGVYLSGHPLEEYQSALDKKSSHSMNSLEELDGCEVVLGGLVHSISPGEDQERSQCRPLHGSFRTRGDRGCGGGGAVCGSIREVPQARQG